MRFVLVFQACVLKGFGKFSSMCASAACVWWCWGWEQFFTKRFKQKTVDGRGGAVATSATRPVRTPTAAEVQQFREENYISILLGLTSNFLKPLSWLKLFLQILEIDAFHKPLYIWKQNSNYCIRGRCWNVSSTENSLGCPDPFLSFAQAEEHFPPYIMEKIGEAGFSDPTPIQAQAWPILIAGRDLIGIFV